MPKDTDDIEDLDLPSSEQAPLDDAKAAPEKSANFVDANSSDAADGTDTALNVVRDVVDTRKAADAGSSPEGEEAGLPAEVEPKRADNEGYTDVPFHKHPRFQQLLREKKTADVDAVRYRNVETFLESNGLTPVEAADALENLVLAKTNPVAAWEKIKPWVQNLAVAAGVVLPPDLAQRVQSGALTREVAVEVSRARAQVHSVQTQQTFAQQQAERRQVTEHQNSIIGAAANWEADRKLKDPNFDAKMLSLQKEIAFYHATEGRPKDAAGVIDQCNRAYKAVNASFRPPVPVQAQRKAPIRMVAGGQVAGTASAEPNSTLEIIRSFRRQG